MPAKFLNGLTTVPVLDSAYGGTGINNAGRTLTISSNGGALAFAAASLALTIPATGTAVLGGGSLAAGRVPFATDANTLSSDAAFVWDNTNKRLGLGAPTPASPLHILNAANAFATLETTNAANYAYFVLTSPSKSYQFALAGASAFNANNFYVFDQTANATRLMITTTGSMLVGLTSGLTGAGDLHIGGNTQLNGNVGFYSTSPQAKPTVSGSRASNAALTSLCSALATLGLITNSTT